MHAIFNSKHGLRACMESEFEVNRLTLISSQQKYTLNYYLKDSCTCARAPMQHTHIHT